MTADNDRGGKLPVNVTRRQLAMLGATAAVSAASLQLYGVEAAGQRRGEVPPLAGEFLMNMYLDVNSDAMFAGARQINEVAGGSFEGPDLKGVILRPAGDWGVQRPDRSYEVEVRMQLKTDDGQFIFMQYGGIIDPARNAPGHDGHKDLYWRTWARFETAAAKYLWLTRIVAVGVHFEVPRQADPPGDPKMEHFGYHMYKIV